MVAERLESGEISLGNSKIVAKKQSAASDVRVAALLE